MERGQNTACGLETSAALVLPSACLSAAVGLCCFPSHELLGVGGILPRGWGSPGGVLAGHGADPGPFPLQVILSESSPAGEVPFFETWMLTCMPEEGKILNPDHPCFCPDSTKVESLVALLNNSSEMKLV